MSSSQSIQQTDDMFYAAEKAGLKLAIKGRIVTVVLVTLLMVLSRDAERAPDFLLAGALFTALGLLHFWEPRGSLVCQSIHYVGRNNGSRCHRKVFVLSRADSEQRGQK